jgi:hypothetical protein
MPESPVTINGIRTPTNNIAIFLESLINVFTSASGGDVFMAFTQFTKHISPRV